MKYLILTIILGVLCTGYSLKAEEPVELEGLNNPSAITVTPEDIFITDGITVNVFSRKDFSRKVSFGKAGSGPGEFQSGRRRGGSVSPIIVYPDGDNIVVFNSRRHLFFTKEGKYIREQNIGKRTSALAPFEGGYLGTQFGRQNNKFFMKFLWFDKEYKSGAPIKSLELDASRRFSIFGRNPAYTTIGNRIYLADRTKPKLAIYDRNSVKHGDIEVDFERPDLTAAKVKGIKEYYKDMLGADRFKRVSRFMDIPSKYPSFIGVKADGKYLYLITWSSTDKGNLTFVYNKEGKLVKKIHIKMEMVSAVAPYPFDIKAGTFYQLIENDDTEEWDLHSTKLI